MQMRDIIAYLLCRVATCIRSDEWAGRIKMATFKRIELGCLVKVLKMKYGNRMQLTKQIIKADPAFFNTQRELKRRNGELNDTIHARCMWWSDEERLIATTSRCTGGLQQRAILRALRCSSARVADALRREE